MATYHVFDLRYLFALFLWSISLTLSAQDTLTLERLDYSFVSYSDGTFTPLTSLEDSNVAGLFISCSDEVIYEFCGSRDFEIWLDGQLLLDNEGSECVYIESKNFCELTDKETAYLSIVAKDGLLGVTARTILIVQNSVESNGLMVRNEPHDYWIIGFLAAVLLLMTVRILRGQSSWSIQRPNLREYNKRFLNVENIVHLFLLSVVCAFCYSYILHKADISFVLYMSGIILSFGLVKIIWTFISSSIFNCWKWANWQLTTELRFWLIITIGLFFSLLIKFMISPEMGVEHSVIFLIVSVMTVILLSIISFTLMSQKGLKNLHIFIYLCTTEILPITLLVYWFLK